MNEKQLKAAVRKICKNRGYSVRSIRIDPDKYSVSVYLRKRSGLYMLDKIILNYRTIEKEMEKLDALPN
jgi:hypothetical protein